MRLLLVSLLVSGVAGCSARCPGPKGLHEFDPNREGTRGQSGESSSVNVRTIVVAFPTDRIEQVIDEWNESRKRLRFSRGCILLVGSGCDPVDGTQALQSGTYPLGDDRDLELASFELTRVHDANELRVTSRHDLELAKIRVVDWLESLGGVVIARDDGE